MVREHSAHTPKSKQPERKVKATASKTNAGAFARGRLTNRSPDVHEDQRLGPGA